MPVPIGIRLVDRAMRLHPVFSIARMDAELLARVQQTVIPDRSVASLVLGRLQKGVAVATTSYAAPHGDVPLRVYRPTSRRGEGGRPLIVAFHGGGFALGSARQGDWASSIVARDVGAVVVSVDYRLAPTHPFPAAVEDCYGALVWAAAHARDLGARADRIGVMESAGGNLAAVVAILARDRGGPELAHQALFYPVTDMTEAVAETESFRTNTHGIVVSHESLETFRGHYLGTADPRDQRLSPVHADSLAGLPPAVIVVAGLDPLHDSGVAYAEALVAAGGRAQVEDFHRMPHGFLGFPYLARSARSAMAAVVASQRAALTARRTTSV